MGLMLRLTFLLFKKCKEHLKGTRFRRDIEGGCDLMKKKRIL